MQLILYTIFLLSQIGLYDIILKGVLMNQLIKDILNQIDEKEYVAYVVGGYPRDLFVNRKSFDSKGVMVAILA